MQSHKALSLIRPGEANYFWGRRDVFLVGREHHRYPLLHLIPGEDGLRQLKRT